MHILWTPSWYPTLDQPEIGSIFADQVELFRDAGVRVGVIAVNPITSRRGRSGSLELDRENQVIRQNIATIPHGIVPGERWLISRYADRLGQRYEREFGIPDVIHAHSVYPGILVAQALAQRWQVPYGITEYLPSSLTKNLKSFRYRMIRDAVADAAFRNAGEQNFAAQLSQYYGGAQFDVTTLPVPGEIWEASQLKSAATGLAPGPAWDPQRNVAESIQRYREVAGQGGPGPEVLFISRIHLPEAAAASLRLAAVEKAVRSLPGRVRVLTSKPPSSIPLPTPDPAVKRLSVLRDKEDYLRGYLPYLSFDLPAFAHVIVGRKPNIAVVEPPPTTGTMIRLAATVRRFPYIWYAADVWSDASESTGAPAPVVRAVRMMEKFAISGAAGVVAVSDGVAQRVRELGGKNILVSPNGADTELFSPHGPGPSAAELTTAGVTGQYFIYAGTASEWQGADIFVKAFETVLREFPDTQLVFLSRGSQIPAIQAAAAELSERLGLPNAVRVLDPVSPEAAARWQRAALAALVSIVPGQGYDFAYPTKVLTALACGTPVVYAGAGPARKDIVADRLGLVAEFTAADIAAVLQQIRRDPITPTERERLSRWVQENRSMDAMGRAVASFIRASAAAD